MWDDPIQSETTTVDNGDHPKLQRIIDGGEDTTTTTKNKKNEVQQQQRQRQQQQSSSSSPTSTSKKKVKKKPKNKQPPNKKPTTPITTPTTPTSSTEQQHDHRGISSNTFTRDEMMRIQSQWQDETHRNMRGDDPYNQGWVYENDEEDDNNNNVAVDDYDYGVTSVLTGVKSWWQRRREARQRDELARQVERQRQLLERGECTEEQLLQVMFHSDAAAAVAAQSRSKKNSSTTSPKCRVGRPNPTPSGDGITVSVTIDESSLPPPPLEEPPVKVVVVPEPPSPHPFCPYILTLPLMTQIAARGLPPSLLFSKWTRLYSLSRDGDSFDTMLRRVEGRRKTLLVVKSFAGRVFGGFADDKWEHRHEHDRGGVFYGSGQAMLFKVVPSVDEKEEEVVIYKWSGANRYIQLCDAMSKKLAMGGGGVEGSFGLCIEDDFRRGSTGHCETFENEPLDDSGQFDVAELEVWGFVTGQF